MPTVFVGIGSNIDSEENLQKGAKLVRKHWPDVRFSSVYRTAPLEVEDQPPFLNAVCTFKTDLTHEDLKVELQKIEAKLGKSLPFPKGPRTLDLDLLLYGDLILPNPASPPPPGEGQGEGNHTLIIPHPRMHLRRFVLEPLCELVDPSSIHPVLRKTWRELLTGTHKQSCDALIMAL